MFYTAELLENNQIKIEIDKELVEKKESFMLSDLKGYNEKLEIISKTNKGKIVEYVLTALNIALPCELYVFESHHFNTPLRFNYYVKTDEFIHEYVYDKDDLGPTYSSDKTTFKVFSPLSTEVNLMLELDDLKLSFPMSLEEKGVYSVTVNLNLDRAKYRYLVKINGQYHEATDPYAYSSTGNGLYSVVINPEICKVNRHDDCLPEFNHPTEAIIYELSVRDFSSHKSSRIINKGKFIGFMEKGTKYKSKPTGIDYLKSLGITHVQLMPIFDFGRVDEYHQFDFYNWGYDPIQYSIPEGSYVTDCDDAYARVIECQEMIESIHANGMRVNLDVVYNHLFNKLESNFDHLLPNYYFRMDETGKLSNGSFCGNDFDSLMPMARKYIIDSIMRWVKMYNIDGLRFDLMGIQDYKLINEILEKCRQIKPNFMVYGEGWDMPTFMDSDLKASMDNAYKQPHIGFFNDRFRNLVAASADNESKRAYITKGEVDLESLQNYITGGFFIKTVFTSPENVINYLECHDNYSLYDKMKQCLPYETEDNLLKRQKLGLALILLSQGISFLHAGIEFADTKNGDHNSYISSDKVNGVDYSLMVKNYDLVEYTKRLIQFRKDHPGLRERTVEGIFKNVEIVNDGNVLFYRLFEEKLLIVINPNYDDYIINNPHEVVFDENGFAAEVTNLVQGLSVKIFKEQE